MSVFKILCLICITHLSICQAETLPPIYHNTNVVLVEAKEATLFCRTFGSGAPMIVVHGGPGLSQDYLLPEMARLADPYQMIFYDQRACGSSTGAITPETINIQTFIEDLDAVRKHFKHEKVILLGHSWGALLAVQYAIAHPESVEALILLNECPLSSTEFAAFEQEVGKRLAPVQTQLSELEKTPDFIQSKPSALEKYFRLIFTHYCCDQKKADLLNLSFSNEAASHMLKVLGIFDTDLFKRPYNFYDQAKQIKVPTLIVHGECDPVPVSAAEALHKTISTSQYILIKDCGHFPYIEQPEVFFPAIRRFLNREIQ